MASSIIDRPRRPSRIPRVGGTLAVLGGLALSAGVASATGQWLDARQPRGGELLIQLTGSSAAVDQRFETDGTRRPLADVFAFELDDRIEPRLDSLDAALPELFAPFNLVTETPSTLGVLKLDLLFERTSMPLNLELGLTDWLSVFTVVPIVKGRSFSGPFIEDGTASAGTFAESPDEFFTGLSSTIDQLESIVNADTLSAARQQTAQALLTDARALETGLEGLRQLPYLPTDSSSAGRQIASVYESLRGGFSEFELEIPDLVLGSPIAGADGAQFITEAGFGIESPRKRSTGIKFGDIEVGLRLQPLNTFRPRGAGDVAANLRVRLQLGVLWRFPSGSEPVAGRITDPGTGEGQADLELHSTLDVGLGSRIWLSLFGGYTVQFEAELRRLLTDPASPLQLGAQTALVTWDPGDVLRLAVLPRVNFTKNITFSGIFLLAHHGRDALVAVDAGAMTGAFTPADLEAGTEYTARTVGFAARYASTEWHGGRRDGIPVEVELRYTRTVSASDGYVPRWGVWEVGLRYYQSIFR